MKYPHKRYYTLDAHLGDEGAWIVATFQCRSCERATLIIYRNDATSIPCPKCHPTSKERYTERFVGALDA